LGANGNANGEPDQQKEEENVTGENRSHGKSRNHDEVQQDEWDHFGQAEGVGGEHSRHGSAKEAKDEPAKKSTRHDSRVSEARVIAGEVHKVERPKGNANDSGQHCGRKKDAKWFPAQIGE
jgi:hypothetical protein